VDGAPAAILLVEISGRQVNALINTQPKIVIELGGNGSLNSREPGWLMAC
jgi:hypothetical protein